jgi:lipopolysaccharide export system permease protein
MSRRRLIAYTLAPAFFVMVLVAYTSLLLSPSGVSASRNLIEVNQSSSALKIALEGRFRVDNDSGWVTYIEKVRNGSEMENIFLARSMVDEEGSNRVELIGADSGRLQESELTGERMLQLENGVRQLGTAGALDYRFLQFKQLDMTMPAARLPERRSLVDGTSTIALWKKGDRVSIAALQWRVSLALLVPIVTLLGIAFSRTNPRQGRYTKLFPAFLVFLIYLVMLNAARDAVAKGSLPLWPGLGWIHLGFLSLALSMLYGDVLKRLVVPNLKKSSAVVAGGTE